jgi:hypothetical protein
MKSKDIFPIIGLVAYLLMGVSVLSADTNQLNQAEQIYDNVAKLAKHDGEVNVSNYAGIVSCGNTRYIIYPSSNPKSLAIEVLKKDGTNSYNVCRLIDNNVDGKLENAIEYIENDPELKQTGVPIKLPNSEYETKYFQSLSNILSGELKVYKKPSAPEKLRLFLP